jgi:chromosome segregation ATPase
MPASQVPPGCENGSMDQRATEDLRRLAAQDGELAAREHRLQELDATVRELRERAAALDEFFGSYDQAERRARAAIESAEVEVSRRRTEVAEAEAALAAERDEERRELARRALARAEDHLSVALTALERASADAAQLERDAAAWQRELPLLEARAVQLTDDLPELALPGSDAQELIAWASHAHAALFVAIRQIEAERERVIREGNELASALLGEPTYGSTVAQALDRVERVTH